MKLLSDYLEKNMGVIRKRLRNVVTNQTDIDDIIQEVCVAILHAKPDLDAKELPKYFTRVLFSKVAAYKNAQCDVTVLAGFVHKEAAEHGDPAEALEKEEEKQLIPKLIEENVSNETARQGLHLIYEQGCSVGLAADIVGMPRANLHMANTRFRKAVAGVLGGV